MALILNIETSSETCSVAVSKDGMVTAALQSSETKSHASILTVLIEKLLHDQAMSVSSMDAIAVSMGPGSYTGLRIGVSVAKGLCYGAGIPLIAVNTLQAMMNGLKIELSGFESRFTEEALFIPMLDARRLEVYLAIFSKDGKQVSGTVAEVMDENSFADLLVNRSLVFFGSGADKIQQLLRHENACFIGQFSPKAAYMASLTEKAYLEKNFEDVAYFEPFYLKDFVATIPKRKVI
jgi:tRNA threonylcarbamoyladenosine biosynthesis protein TsaB